MNSNLISINNFSSTVFTQIIEGKIPATILDSSADNKFYTIIAKDQVNPGHLLVVPKIAYPNYYQMPPNEFLELMAYTQIISNKLLFAYPECARISLHIIGFEINHLHIHLIPCNSHHELNFDNTTLLTENMANNIEKRFLL